MYYKAGAIFICMLLFPLWAAAQAGRTLNADGRTDTYQLIESYGYGVEVPDCGHPVKHITQRYDPELKKEVLVFTLHAELDDDRCGSKDRQRAEIKTFGPSPESMKGHRGKTHTYRWKFKLDEGFQPSPRFCHIHQVKADAGPQAGAPIVTLTPRWQESGEVLQFMVVTPGNQSTVLGEADLSAFKGVWVEVTETILHDSPGYIEMEIRRVSDGELMLSGESAFDLWREGARFNRPKYGIYRSIAEPSFLRDESVLFADIEFIEVDDKYPEERKTAGWERVPEIMNRFTVPAAAGVAVNVIDFGARGDNLKDNSGAFAEAIAACHRAGGGVVRVPEGLYALDADLELLSGVELALSAGAVLYFRGSEPRRIFGEKQQGVALTGQGRIGGEAPGAVEVIGCRNVRIAGITVSGSWNIRAEQTDRLILEDVRVNSTTAQGAVELISCTRSLVQGCDLESQGDGVVIRSEGLLEDVVVTHNYFRRIPGSALVLGRASPGMIRNVFVENNVFGEVSKHLVSYEPDGNLPGVVEDIYMRDNRSEGYPVETAFYLDQTAGVTDNTKVPVLWYGYFEKFTNLFATQSGIELHTVPRTLRPVESMWFTDIQITGTDDLLVKNGGGRDIYPKNITPRPVTVGDRADNQVLWARLDEYTPGQAPDFWSVAAAKTTMARWPDYSQAYYNAWTYVNGYMFCAFERLYQATGDPSYMEYIRKYVDPFIDDYGNFLPATNNKGITRVPSYCDNLDGMMAGNALVMLYEHTGEERYRLAAKTVRECLREYPRNSDGGYWHNVRTEGQMWIDGIFMGQMFLLRYGRSIDEFEYACDEAVKQIVSYSKSGEQGNSGLYVHGVFEPGHGGRVPAWPDPATGKSPEVWGEGLGWYALVLVEALETIPQNHPGYGEVKDIFVRLAEGLKRTQDPLSGGWYQVVDRTDDPDNWIETSGSAMFTYALQQGINLELLDEKEYKPVVLNGYRSITHHATVNEKGLVDIYEAMDGLGVQAHYDNYITHGRYAINAKEAMVGFVWATEIVEREALKNKRK